MNPGVKENFEKVQSNLSDVKNIVLVMSGKGGVGKSSIAVNTVIGLAKRGYKVGLLDTDLHGPNVMLMLGADGEELVADSKGRVKPVIGRDNIKIVSLAANVAKDDAIIWRGPIKISVILQFLKDVDWGQLDFLIVDSPPGTGDEPLTVVQFAKDRMKGAIIVTTPQAVALLDTVRSISFAKKMGLPIIGVVENMSQMICPHCGKEIELFPRDEAKWRELGAKVIAKVPFDPRLSFGADEGVSVWDLEKSPAKAGYEQILDEIVR